MHLLKTQLLHFNMQSKTCTDLFHECYCSALRRSTAAAVAQTARSNFTET